MNSSKNRFRFLKSALIGFALLSQQGTFGKVEKTMKEQGKTNKEAQKSQENIDKIAEKTDEMTAEYGQILSKISTLKIYLNQMNNVITSQDEEIQGFEKKISEITDTQRNVLPLMVRMVDTLTEFVELDKPFLMKERTQRIKGLQNLLNRADITTSEKFRRILEAYQVENEYGRTIEAYRDNLNINGKDFLVDYLKIGRTTLLYQSIDGKMTGYWKADEKKWVSLPANPYRAYVQDGIKVARKQMPPDMIVVPLVKLP